MISVGIQSLFFSEMRIGLLLPIVNGNCQIVENHSIKLYWVLVFAWEKLQAKNALRNEFTLYLNSFFLKKNYRVDFF